MSNIPMYKTIIKSKIIKWLAKRYKISYAQSQFVYETMAEKYYDCTYEDIIEESEFFIEMMQKYENIKD